MWGTRHRHFWLGGGLQVGEDGAVDVFGTRCVLRLFLLGGLVFEAFDEELEEAGLFFGGGEFGAWSDGAVGGIVDDFIDCLRGFGGFAGGGRRGAGQVGTGDLEAVEQEAGAARVDVVGGDAAEDLCDGGLDVGAVVGVGERELEGVAAGAAGTRVLDGAAGGVVVVAEIFVAQAWACTAASVGEDVAALEVLGFGGLHGVAPWCHFCVKSSKEKTCLWTLGPGRSLFVWLNAKVRLAPDLFVP
jgi:hypothetical protein